MTRGVFHLLHHEHQARYDKMFPYLWAYAILLALAGFVMDTPANIFQGLYTIITTEDSLITAMVGRSLESRFPAVDNTPGEPILSIQHLSTKFAPHLQDVSFEVRGKFSACTAWWVPGAPSCWRPFSACAPARRAGSTLKTG